MSKLRKEAHNSGFTLDIDSAAAVLQSAVQTKSRHLEGAREGADDSDYHFSQLCNS